jgi:leucyl/phenylalanyl-tRNA--protein transferase
MPPPADHPDLAPDMLLSAYAAGVFPMDDAQGRLRWYRPDPRGVVPLGDGFHVGKNLRRRVRQGTLEATTDRCFERVMRRCAEGRPMWISERLIRAYMQLHAIGAAHSVEVWKEGELVGGLYGVAVGGAFCGESMFSRQTDASKVALVYLVDTLQRAGFVLLDTQWTTPHLEQFGAYEISARQYEERLARALALRPDWPDRLVRPDQTVSFSD